MKVRRMDLYRDFEAIKLWYETRKLPMPSRSSLPAIGFIVSGIAAGFLVQTDTDWAILEPFIANPVASKKDRDNALRSIIIELTVKARELGYKQVFGFSANKNMVKRGSDLGFSIIEHNTLTVWKDLKGN